MITVAEIASAIEEFAPRQLQESYDNAGLQIGDPSMSVSGVIVCLDTTFNILKEAIKRRCNLIVSHHPLLFGGMKHITPLTEQGRIIMEAIRAGIAVYAAHTNLDRTWEGVSYEMAHSLHLSDISVLAPDAADATKGLGIIGTTAPQPALAFLRQVKDTFGVECLRYSHNMPSLTVRKVAVCGGAGASLIHQAIERGADVIVTGDIKYHDYTSYSGRILIADIGHFESEICTKKIFARLLHDKFPDLPTYLSECEMSPIACL